MVTDVADLAAFFEGGELDLETLDRFADAAHASFNARERFETLTRERQQSGTAPLRVGAALLILGRYSDALEQLDRAPASKQRFVLAAQAALALNHCDPARDYLRQAAANGWPALDVDLRMAAVYLRAGDIPAAEKLIQKHEQAGQDRAEWHFGRGLLLEARGNYEGTLEALERCLLLDPDNSEAMFRAARLYDQWGDDAQALELYDRLALQPRAHVNALLNAAVIYEDLENYDEAAECLRRVLRVYPNHTRARLYLKDVESCRAMVIDETAEDRTDARSRLLDTPLSEFELSVRARNCLKKINIRTLGELIHLTEAELLAYKNFGETSLNEIKALLGKKGMRLGQSPDEIDVAALPEEAPPPKAPPVPPGQEAVLSRPVTELELSVRARRCLQRLNVQTLGDLLQYSEADLLATRNFGVTSLNEVKTRLSDHGLQLAPKKQP